MRINNNLMAMNTHRQLGINSANGAKSIEKLSSGYRINRAGDDAAGLAISEKMRGQIRGLNQASRNSQDAISLVQTAEGALNESQSILQRMRELAVQSANDTNADADRSAIQNEMDQLTSELNRISESTEFNKKKLLNGDLGITGDGRKIVTPTVGTGMADLAIEATSTLETGGYKIAVTNNAVNIAGDGQSGTIADASVLQEEVDLGEGSYRVNVVHQAGAKTVGSIVDATTPLLEDTNSINIHSGSSLVAEAHTINVTMNTVKSATNVDSGGITLTDAGAAGTAVGNYVISTSAEVAGADATTGAIATTALYAAANTGAITDIEIVEGSTLSSADGLKISVDQMTTAAETFTSAHLVEQGITLEATDVTLAGDAFSLTVLDTGLAGSATTATVVAGDVVVTLGMTDGDNATLTPATNTGFTFTADAAGLDGNKINAQFVQGAATGGSVVVDVISEIDGTETIRITADNDVLHSAIKTAIEANATAAALVDVTVDNGTSTGVITEAAAALTGGGDNAVVNATQADVKAAIDLVGSTGLDVTVETAGAAVAASVSQDFVDGSTEAQTTFTFTLEDTNGTYGQATATFSDSSGSTTIKLGDVSFTVDNSEMFAGDTTFDAGKIALTVNNSIRVTDSDGNYTEKVQADDTTAATVTFGDTGNWVDAAGVAIVSANKIDLAIDTNDIGEGGFIRGNDYYVNVDSTNNYAIQLENNAGDAVGDAYEFTAADLGNADTYTNVGLGEMNSGLFVDFDQAALQGLATGADVDITFTVGTADAYTAELQNADGTAIADTSSFTLNAGETDKEVNLGEGVVFQYSSNDATSQLDGGGQHYFSVKAGADNFEMTLTNTDTSEQIGVVESFNKGDTVSFGDSGVSIATGNTIVAGDTTFTVDDDILDNSISMQIGANTGQRISIDINDVGASALGVSSSVASATKSVTVDGKVYEASYKDTSSIEADGTISQFALDITTHEKATAAIEVVDTALTSISSERAKLGSVQNRLEHTIKNLDTSSENLQASESRIRDVDMAKEMMEFTKNNILQQAAQAMLAQANQAPQGVLQLLR